MVTKKQGVGDESETREGRLREDPEMGVCWRKGRSGEDPGKIHRSKEVQCSGVLEREGQGKGDKDGEMRITGCLKECLVESDEGD